MRMGRLLIGRCNSSGKTDNGRSLVQISRTEPHLGMLAPRLPPNPNAPSEVVLANVLPGFNIQGEGVGV